MSGGNLILLSIILEKLSYTVIVELSQLLKTRILTG